MPMNPELDTHPAIISIRRDGFLSDAIARVVPSLRELNRSSFDFSMRANGVGQRIMNAAEVACVDRSTHDPICVATRFLIRSLSGFQAVVLLAERGMTVEADTLIRGLYENSLWLGYLHTAPEAAVEALRTDELHSQRGRDRAVLGQLDRTDAPDLILKARLMERVAEVNRRCAVAANLASRRWRPKGNPTISTPSTRCCRRDRRIRPYTRCRGISK